MKQSAEAHGDKDSRPLCSAPFFGLRWLVSEDDDLLSRHRVKSVEIVSVTTFLQQLKRKP